MTSISRMSGLLILLQLMLLALLNSSHAEIFSAMVDLEHLIHGESYIMDSVDRYIQAEQKRLKDLKEVAKQYQAQNREYLLKDSTALTNPVNAFLTIKQITTGWDDVEKLMKDNFAETFLQNITTQRVEAQIKFPGKDDVEGAGVAILRLQDTYKIPTTDIAAGRIKGILPSNSLTAADCFEVCRIAYNNRDFYHTLLWAQEAVDKLQTEEPKTIEEHEVLEHLAYALYQQGNIHRAMYWTERLHLLNPDHPRAEGNIKYYNDMLKEQGQTAYEVDSPADLPTIKNYRPVSNEEHTDYEALCRNEGNDKGKAYEATLYCYYKNTHPVYPWFIRFAPVKVEIMHWQPKIVVFRDAISDEETDMLKQIAYPKLRRATVFNAKGELEPADYRTAKSAWLQEYEDPLVPVINRRIDIMTDLDMDTAEQLQMANYGLGGHYEPHFDMSTRENDDDRYAGGAGNRIATLLFYLEAPEAGGATIYTTLKVTLFPSKNDAAFWFNIKQSGKPDLSTRHAACPVLSGQKWVANKWIHERGQEYRRPCGPSKDTYV